jgi:chromosome segregation protein
MLKRLELVGFKSFAERTVFDFAAGITAIVGPNGSGKSNVVDSVKWVLGEQSAKSLRGSEMADVIFNGSATRRSLGLAEVTMTFDNAKKVLASESEEVQITRRVYRSGEGEYLINGQVCRLKDIKELFLGSGAGADAYSIIEQGRVDVLLQASTKDRRTIFEEAAGISRFKAKKIETLRKLERVDQNVQRLKDIIEEVEKQLRSVKLQASKAQRYQEYSGRLKELRLALGLQEYHQFAGGLQIESAKLESLRSVLAQQSEQAESWDRELSALENALATSDAAIHARETVLGNARQQIAAEETTLGHERALTADLEGELSRTRLALAELDGRVASLADAAEQVTAELRQAEAQSQEQRVGVRAIEDELQRVVLRLAVLQKQVAADQEAHLESMRQAARLQNDAVSHRAHTENLTRQRDRLHRQSEEAAENLASVDLELQELTRADEELHARLAVARQGLTDQRQETERLRQLRDTTANIVAELREQRSGLASRVEVLEGLERSQEGLGTGVREMLDCLNQPEPGPWRTVVGMVADLLTVRREYAPLIDVALGERAQRFLARDPVQLHRALEQRATPFSGRVSFLTLTPSSAEPPPPTSRLLALSRQAPPRLPLLPPELRGHAGIVALAASLVSCEHPEFADLPTQLLGRTLIVRDLATAREVAIAAPGHRFVTLHGEILEPDGTLTVGTHHAESGVLSRKSELRELRAQAAGFDQRIADTEADLAGLREQIAALDERALEHQREIDVLGEQAADLRSRVGQHRERRASLHEEVVGSRDEIGVLETDIAEWQGRWERARDNAAFADTQAQALQQRAQAGEHEAREREELRASLQEQCTAAKVALAQADERLAGLRGRHQQMTLDLEQRRQERRQSETNLSTLTTRLTESQRTMLNASAALARWYLEKESAERDLTELTSERERHRQARQQLLERTQSARAEWREKQEQAHSLELQVNDLRHRRETLVERLREDYQLDLAELYAEKSASGQELPATDSTQANEEIAELRRKLSRLGAVNLEALQELQELEKRATELQTQYDDIASAKRSLEEIIAKINEDSRRLFTETFGAIRTNFQELFRKLFGGGMAEIVLEDETDILESGIEIIARPPGKELRSISLMSGGEKTMTAVALLLAIFRTRPSPFCILDEVDAALDEANIGRFTVVLREFLDRSHFIIITHSKRTMSVADVLYGVTMQESGISKRVAVRFEDWPDDEEQPKEAPALGAFGGK